MKVSVDYIMAKFAKVNLQLSAQQLISISIYPIQTVLKAGYKGFEWNKGLLVN